MHRLIALSDLYHKEVDNFLRSDGFPNDVGMEMTK
jgi:hypothetical protein